LRPWVVVVVVIGVVIARRKRSDCGPKAGGMNAVAILRLFPSNRDANLSLAGTD
jgi:hypothetical protein